MVDDNSDIQDAEPEDFSVAAEMITRETELNGGLYARINDLEIMVSTLTSLLMAEREDWREILEAATSTLVVGSQRETDGDEQES